MAAKVNVISINPAKKTIGALHPELLERVAKGYKAMDDAMPKPHLKNFFNLFFGINKSVKAGWSGKLFAIRFFVAAYFLGIGIMSATSFPSADVPTLMICTGAMIFLGLFERVLSFAGFLLLGSIALTSALGISWDLQPISTPFFNEQAAFCSLFALILAIIGPGRYSIDQIMRHTIYAAAKRRQARRISRNAERAADMRMSYRAWQAAE